MINLKKQIDSTKNDTPVRHPKFDFSKSIEECDPNSLMVAHFLNALSLFIPIGETNFINSIKNFEEHITNPNLLDKAKKFYEQESAHTSAHMAYNNMLRDRGYEIDRICGNIERLRDNREMRIKRGNKYVMDRRFLAATMCCEYLICLCAEHLLETPEILYGVEKNLTDLWVWHSIEEIEHKAVAHDLYYAMGGLFSEKTTTLLFYTAAFVFFTIRIYFHFLRKDKMLFNAKGWWYVLRISFIKPGFFIKILPKYFKLFRFGYSPWDNESYHLVEKWKSEHPDINNSYLKRS